MIGSLRKEFEHETKVSRRMLERIPRDQLEWRPHEKSYTIGELGGHIVECLNWVESIFAADELDFHPTNYKVVRAASVDELLRAFDDAAAIGTRTLAGVDDATLSVSWRFKIMGRQLFEKSRAAVLRDFTLSHMIHHRGQLSVYLRLLNVPVPGAYGPSADEIPKT